ncbi:MAG: response regulator [Bacteroidales bacterium]
MKFPRFKEQITKYEISVFIAFIVAGVIFISYNVKRIQNDLTNEILQIGRSIEVTLNKAEISKLNAKAEDISKPEYQHIKNTLKSIVAVNSKARFAYLYMLRNGKIYFIADSEPENSVDYSPPGQDYPEAHPIEYQPFYTGKAVVTDAASDRWGTWISALIPIKDKKTGKIVAVFGMDFNAKKWNNSIIFEIFQSSTLVLLLIISILSIIFIRHKNRTLSIEIIDRKEAQLALQKSENQKEAILQAIPDLIFIFNKNGDYVDIYAEENSKLLYPKEQLKGMNIKDIFSAQVATQALDAFHRAYEEKKMIQFSYDLVIDHKKFFFEARIVPSVGDNVLTIVRDITDRKESELLSQARQERTQRQQKAISSIAVHNELTSSSLNSTFENLTIEASNAIEVGRTSIWLLSDNKTELNCVTLYENSEFKKTSNTVLKCEDYPIYFDTIQKESRISASNVQNDPRTIEFKESYLVPLNIKSMLDACIYIDGILKGIVCFEHIGEPRKWHSDEEAFATTFAAIIAQTIANNQRKQAESVLFDIIDKNPISIQIVDKSGMTLSVNKAYTNLFKASPASDYSIFDDQQLKDQGFEELLVRAQKGEIVYFPDIIYNSQLSNVSAQNTPNWIQMVIFPLNDEEGNPEKYVLMHENISRRKVAEQELIVAKEHAEESDRLKSAFLANMSHEIRTPMNGILGFTELLKQPSLSGETQQEYINIIQESGERMLNIINNIVDISKIEAKLMQVDLKTSDINQQFDFIYHFFKPEVEKKGLTLVLKKGLENQAATITTDTEKAYAILINLVKNAIKYSTHGSIEFGYNLNENKELLFFVKDTGIGIPLDMQSAIFERFIQATNSLKTITQGTGLGLAISKAYVEMLGGRIWVESDGKSGSAFYFTLPYNPVAHTNEANAKQLKNAPTASSNNLKILIAEDDSTSRKLITMVMKKYAREIICAHNGEEAVNECKKHPDFDLIMMDIQMPIMSGYEATQEIRKFNKRVIIIAQTANAMADDKSKALSNGFNDYISKPIDKNKIEAFISKYFT